MKCDTCPADAVRMVGESNELLACAKCVVKFRYFHHPTLPATRCVCPPGMDGEFHRATCPVVPPPSDLEALIKILPSIYDGESQREAAESIMASNWLKGIVAASENVAAAWDEGHAMACQYVPELCGRVHPNPYRTTGGGA